MHRFARRRHCLGWGTYYAGARVTQKLALPIRLQTDRPGPQVLADSKILRNTATSTSNNALETARVAVGKGGGALVVDAAMRGYPGEAAVRIERSTFKNNMCLTGCERSAGMLWSYVTASFSSKTQRYTDRELTDDQPIGAHSPMATPASAALDVTAT